jgi:hypothetical protein
MTSIHPVLCAGVVKASIIEAGSTSTVTPWYDGSSSGLLTTLRESARYCLHDRDPRVSSAAIRAIGIWNAQTSSCVPVMHTLTKQRSSYSETTEFHHNFDRGTPLDYLQLGAINKTRSFATTDEQRVNNHAPGDNQLGLQQDSNPVRLPVVAATSTDVLTVLQAEPARASTDEAVNNDTAIKSSRLDSHLVKVTEKVSSGRTLQNIFDESIKPDISSMLPGEDIDADNDDLVRVAEKIEENFSSGKTLQNVADESIKPDISRMLPGEDIDEDNDEMPAIVACDPDADEED